MLQIVNLHHTQATSRISFAIHLPLESVTS
jgi:hypothetical protein